MVLPPDSAASAGARGVYDNIEHNTMLRDAGYVELGVDPADPGAEVDVPPEGGNGGNGGTAQAPTNTAVPTSSSRARRSLAQWANGPASRPATPTPGRSTVWASALTLRPTMCRRPMWADSDLHGDRDQCCRLGGSASVNRRRGGVSYAGGAEPTGASTTAIRRPGLVG